MNMASAKGIALLCFGYKLKKSKLAALLHVKEDELYSCTLLNQYPGIFQYIHGERVFVYLTHKGGLRWSDYQTGVINVEDLEITEKDKEKLESFAKNVGLNKTPEWHLTC
jgi:hypothetical protein